ncbi:MULTISPECIES: 50S ribosomal protein L17 [unclassified Desulfovibrio]|uniref:50S ribosomal protein L17 n=1 Tax=unclassified Desulfovibrio TaxID=2593640 RepID=UPI002FD97ADF
MRHSNSGRKFSRTPAHRKAMLHNLAKALLIHGKIRTTEIKAKELRRVVEPLITLAKRNDLHARRQAYRVLNDHALVKRLFDEIGPVFAGVPGGYTRILKMAMPRKGDNAPMAIIELTRSSEAAAAEAPKAAKAASAKEAKPAAEEAAAKPKRTRKPKADEADAEAAKEEN